MTHAVDSFANWTHSKMNARSYKCVRRIVKCPLYAVAGDRRSNNARRRFKLLSDFKDKAVLDRETGLVWERQPSNQTFAWPNARLHCAQKAVGERGGWRLPAFNELASLVDPAITDPAVPRVLAGHPFLNV
jgi:hypothetical protein